jgi:hypothetical protein
MAKTVDVDKKAQELAEKLDKASEGLNKPFKGLVDELAKVNTAVAISAADIRKDTRDSFSGFLSRKKLAKAMVDFDKTEFETNKATSAKTTSMRDKLLQEQQDEINRNQNLNAAKKAIAENELAIQNNLNNNMHGSVEANIERQKEIDEIQQQVDAKETEIKKFRLAKIEKANKDLEKLDEDRVKLEEDKAEQMKKASSSEEFDNFSGSLKNLTGGLLDIGGMLDDVTKFGNDIKNVGAGIASAFSKVTSFGANVSEIGQGLKATTDSAGGLPDAFALLKDSVMGLMGSIAALWLTFKTKVKDIAGSIVGAGKKKFGEAKDFVADKATKGQDKVTEIFNYNKDAMMDSVTTLGNNMKMGAKSMGGKGLKAIKSAPAQLMKGARMFVSLLSKIPMMLAAIPALLASPIVLIGLAVLALIIGLVIIWMKFKDQIIEKFEMMKTKVTGVVTSLIDGFLEVWQKVKDWFGDKVHGIKKFLGLTTEEEDAEQEKKKLEKQQKKEAMKLKEEEIDAQMKEKFGDKSLNFFGGSKEAKEEKKRMMEEAAGNYDENLKLDNTSSKDLLSERDSSLNAADAAKEQLQAREKAVEERMKTANITQNGKTLEGDEKRAFLEDMADKGRLDDKRATFEGASNEQLDNFAENKEVTAQKLQAELETREDYIPANMKGDARLSELQDEDLFGGLTEKEEMEMNRIERGQGDRIKDGADRAKEMGPKRESIQSTAVAQQNTNNNVTNNTISSSPNPRPTDNTISRTANVNQN